LIAIIIFYYISSIETSDYLFSLVKIMQHFMINVNSRWVVSLYNVGKLRLGLMIPSKTNAGISMVEIYFVYTVCRLPCDTYKFLTRGIAFASETQVLFGV